MFVILVTPANKNFKPHVWKEGGEFMTNMGAERQVKRMRKMKDLYDKRKKFYDKVEVIPNPLRQN